MRSSRPSCSTSRVKMKTALVSLLRLAVPAQVAKGIAAVGQVHGQVNGQVGPTLLLDMIGVDGDGLVILRQGLGRLAQTLLGAAAVLAATVSASFASLLPPRSGECQCPLSGSILIRPLLSTGSLIPRNGNRFGGF